MAEALVLQLVKGQNRPYHVQGVADMLATKGVKKAGAERALEALVANGSLVRKDFGKQKMYFPDQKGLAALSPEECAAKQAALQQSQAACREQEEAVTALRREAAAAGSVLSLEEMRRQVAELTKQKEQQAGKLAALRGGGARLVSAADVQAAEKAYQAMFDGWARCRRQFRSVWDCVSDGIEGKEEAVFEEMGVETDKAVGADFEGAKALAQPLKKARTALAPLRR
ncbi:Homologous-pairing protein 2 [Chlorella vulgaris]